MRLHADQPADPRPPKLRTRAPHPWEQAYIDRILQGLEGCRAPDCGATADRRRLYLDRLDETQPMRPSNATILCHRHRAALRDPARSELQPKMLRSLAREEGQRPPEERWAELAIEATRTTPRELCPYCGAATAVMATGTGGHRFANHQRDGERCPGSQQVPEIAAVNAGAARNGG